MNRRRSRRSGVCRKDWRTQWLQKKLEDSVAAGDAQYGRIFAKWLLAESVASGESIEQCLLTRSAQWFLRTQDGDLEELLQLLPKEDHEQLLEQWTNCRQVAAHNAEC